MEKNTTNELLNIAKEVFKEYSDIKEFIQNEIVESDLGEILGECSKLVGGLIKLNNYKNKQMFKCFLKGFTIGTEAEEEKVEKLKKYIKDKKSALFISQTLENIKQSKSEKACLILGYMINTIIEENRSLNGKYIILADALTHMFDHDIENFKFIGDYCNLKIYNEKKATRKRAVYFYNSFKTLLNENDIDKNIMFLTLEKSCTYQLLIKNVDANTELNLDLDVSYDKESDNEPEVGTGSSDVSTEVDEYYTMTFVGDLLYKIINILRL
ncbi:hypothetical protein [Clostridium sp. ZS2-4]|uniref:hypothetical protein n=1 Tax=Clostridium sp. ZS2-4 TaxID=2987703 RepID=UPI00227A1326|nr:hypothetical protein [Clostridium sp. ZS2-4]MCY6355372.1 hypothetical protein [Clostridium sp. ZS2-4]